MPPRSAEPKWLSDDEQRSWRAYLRASRLIEAALDRDLRPLGVGLAEYELLSMLSEAPEGRMRMSALADLVVQSRSRVTHTASRLEQMGLVSRQPCSDDRRGVELVLSESGRAGISAMAQLHVASVRRHLIDLMSPQDFAGLGRAMQRVRDAESGVPGSFN